MVRVLLTDRSYQRRAVLGGDKLKFLLRVRGEEQALVGYLPEHLTKSLPMYQRFRGRIIAEVHLPQDQYDAQPATLKALALAREVKTTMDAGLR
jgi:hypothetical protein